LRCSDLSGVQRLLRLFGEETGDARPTPRSLNRGRSRSDTPARSSDQLEAAFRPVCAHPFLQFGDMARSSSVNSFAMCLISGSSVVSYISDNNSCRLSRRRERSPAPVRAYKGSAAQIAPSPGSRGQANQTLPLSCRACRESRIARGVSEMQAGIV